MTHPISLAEIEPAVERAIREARFIDIHTHLFAPAFGELALSGIDELLTYHYLEAELFRYSGIEPARYWSLDKRRRADLVWRTLFVENTPLSEATRGVVAALSALGLDPSVRRLDPLRDYFRSLRPEKHVSRVFELAGVDSVVMTNDPLDPEEHAVWTRGALKDPRFLPALRLDPILNDWEANWPLILAQGYAVDANAAGATLPAVRRFVEDWCTRMGAVYAAVSLPDSFQFPANDVRSRLLCGAVLPACRDLGLPLALMIGVRRQVNPALKLAGDASGKADLRAVEALCREYPENRYLVTLLSRENQHELCVCARKFRNLLPFGCWWFLNNPSIVEEITRERLEMLGTTFVPQHSDARILEQVIYKWRNTRRTLAPILASAYRRLIEDGGVVTGEDVERDVTRLSRANFEAWIRTGSAVTERWA